MGVLIDTIVPVFSIVALGWLLAASMLWLLVLPGTYRALAQDVIGFAQESTDTAIVRWVGLMAIGLGTWLVSLGI